MPTLLLHACCAPCSSAVLEYLSRFFAITLLYYNPNIAPYEEYEKREAELRRHRGQRWDRTPPRSPPPLRGAVPDPRRERPPPVHREPGGGPPGHLRLSVPPSLREQVRPRRGRWRGRCGARPVPAPGRLHPGRCGIKLGAPPRRFRVRLRSDRSARGSASGAPLRPRPPGTFRAFFLLFFRRFFPRCRRRQPSSDRNGIRGAALRAR